MQPEVLRSVLTRLLTISKEQATARPTVINCAAYTKVDLAEKEPELCRRINVEAVQVLAQVCRHVGAKLVHIGSDYVFGSSAPRDVPCRETDPIAPQSVYALSKADGDEAALNAPFGLVVRTCGLYDRVSGPRHANFPTTMLRLAGERPRLRVVGDQTCTPSYVPDIVTGIVELLRHDAVGLYHLTNAGETTWYDFAVELLRLAESTTPIDRITTAEFNAPAPRPAYSVLDSTKAQSLTGHVMPAWEDALVRYVASLDR
ncbi:MAG: NAD(P)-dependent oxidoreductase [Pirellulales bacterium]